MTWVLYVMIMTEARTLQGILSQHYFNTEQECNQFYIDNKKVFENNLSSILEPKDMILQSISTDTPFTIHSLLHFNKTILDSNEIQTIYNNGHPPTYYTN